MITEEDDFEQLSKFTMQIKRPNKNKPLYKFRSPYLEDVQTPTPDFDQLPENDEESKEGKQKTL